MAERAYLSCHHGLEHSSQERDVANTTVLGVGIKRYPRRVLRYVHHCKQEYYIKQ